MDNTQELWQQKLAQSVTQVHELFRLLELSPCQNELVQSHFPLRVPKDFIARMEPRNPNDPLLLQVLPRVLESHQVVDYCNDPLEEKKFTVVPGLLHKYHGRVLLIATGGCAVHCRYCFRRHFPYSDHGIDAKNFSHILDYIRNNKSIHEVILSGGDPLVLKDHIIQSYIHALESIEHVRCLRIHTRFPVVIPDRITSNLLNILSQTRFKTVVVVHINHPNELNDSVAQAMSRLRAINSIVLNQSVLLKGINDCADTLSRLSHRLLDAGIVPYYLHQLDSVQGAAHFFVDLQRGQDIMRILRHTLPGYLVPRFVKEESGLFHKTPL